MPDGNCLGISYSGHSCSRSWSLRACNVVAVEPEPFTAGRIVLEDALTQTPYAREGAPPPFRAAARNHRAFHLPLKLALHVSEERGIASVLRYEPIDESIAVLG